MKPKINEVCENVALFTHRYFKSTIVIHRQRHKINFMLTTCFLRNTSPEVVTPTRLMEGPPVTVTQSEYDTIHLQTRPSVFNTDPFHTHITTKSG